jgi:hypothetical protein
MVSWGMVFCKVVGQVGRSWFPVNVKLVLFNSVLNPIESHLHGFLFLLFDLVVGKAIGC